MGYSGREKLTYDAVFLLDVDNTLLDRNRVPADIDVHASTFDGHVLIYIHKEEDPADAERLRLANHYVTIDEHHLPLARPLPRIRAQYPQGDLQLDNIGDLVRYGLSIRFGNRLGVHLC
jgi:hypothetical protein